MRVALIDSSPEAVRLVRDYFPGIVITEERPDLKFARIQTYEDAMKVIRILRQVADRYLQEYVEDPEDYEERDKR